MQLSHNFTLWDLSTCSNTYKKYADLINPFPENPESIEALKNISQKILEPILSNCDRLILTYGFSSKNLLKYLRQEKAFIAPKCDQHASCEINTRGNYYCKHKGAAVDILTELRSSKLVELVINKQLPFDSIYYYGEDKPLHISWSDRPRKKNLAS